jgi:O-antigen ligase
VDPADRPIPSARAIVVGAYLFSVPSFAYSDSLGLLYIPQIMGAVVLLYAVFDILKDLHISIPWEVTLYGFLGLLAWITALLATSTIESQNQHLGSLLKVVIATLACAQLIKDQNDLLLALRIFVISILLVFFQNLSELRYLSILDKIPENSRFAGTLTNANIAAMYSLAVIWASMLLVMRKGLKLITKSLYAIPIGIALVIIYYSGSKKGLIGIGVFSLFITRLLYIRYQSNPRKRILAILFSVVIIGMAGYFVYRSPFLFRMGQFLSGESVSDLNRLELAKDAIQVWLTNLRTFLVGVGYENFRFYSTLRDFAHSTPFELLASSGFIGFCIFMTFLAALFYRFIRIYRKVRSDETKSVAYATLIFLSLFFIFMFGGVLHDSRELVPILGCLSAFGKYQGHLSNKERAWGWMPKKRSNNAALMGRDWT